jgi:AraC-like DNA-binding protein
MDKLEHPPRRQAAVEAAVPEPPPSRDPGPWRQRVGGFTAVPVLIRKLGLDPAPLLERCGLAPDALDAASNQIAYSAMGCVLSEAAARTGCAHFGLLAGRAWHLADLGVPGELVRNAPSANVALEEFVLHQHLNSESALAFLIRRAGVVDFGYAIYDSATRGTFHLYDAAIAIGLNMLREIFGEDFNPSEVFLPHRPPVDAALYRRHFRCPVRFNAEFASLRFPESILARRIGGASPARLREARAKADAAGMTDLLQAVHRALRILLLRGKASGADVAQALALHRRTLNRRLRAQGTTFQEVLDRTRLAAAMELLEGSELSMLDVAASLGYAGLTPFMRAFKRWTGTTPGAWRHSARQAREPAT